MKETVKKIALCGACLLSAALVSAGPKPESPAAGKLVPALVVVMPSLDDGFLSALKHQQFTTTKGRYQIGVGRNFDVPVALNATGSNQWTLNADGSHSWSLQVTVDGALGARLHVENIHLPPGVSLRVFASDNPSAASPPVTAQDLGMQRDLWMQTIFSDSVTLECDAAAGADLNAVAFEVTGLSHIFEIPELNSNLKEGTCHNDVTCYQNWSAQASGVARISFVDGGNSYLCSGCLLASSVKPNANYFLTANHCIPNQGVASSVEWFWFYQTSRCNGAPPSLDSVPTTSGGGDLLAGGVSSDFSLLRVRQSVPGGAAHLVWSTATPAQNESLAGIHHPGGTFKRISFGNFYGSDSGFWAVRWRSGVTEPGSSGSPLFNANQEVIGQLNGGFNGPGSSCSNPSAPDQYGRFDVTYQSVKQWVGADPGGGGPSNLPAAGNYYGLFSDTSYGVAPESSGYARLTVNQKGHFSASLQFAAARLGFSGQFDGTGSAIVDISRGRFAGYEISLQLNTSAGEDQITGTVAGPDFTSELTVNRAGFNGRTTLSPQAGRYTLVIPSTGSGDDPGGDSYGIVTVNKAGRVHLSGSLADGTKFSQSSALSSEGEWPLYSRLRGGQEFLYSWSAFDGNGISGNVSWIKQQITRTKYYKSGFVVNSSLSSSPYSKPLPGNPLLYLPDGYINFQGGDLSQPVSNEISVDFKNRVTNVGGAKMSLRFSVGSGTFAGRVVDPNTGKSFPFHGVVLQNQNVGLGYFTGPDTTGEVTIGE